MSKPSFVRLPSSIARLGLGLLSLISAYACGASNSDGLENTEADAVKVASFVEAEGSGSSSALAEDEGTAFDPDLTSTYGYLQNYAETALVAGYAAEMLYANSTFGWTDVFMRYTTDGWATYQDVPYASEQTHSHLHARIEIPEGSTKLEYAVYRRLADGRVIWDNNRNRNFQMPVNASLYRVVSNGDVRTIRYFTHRDSAVLHYGVNEWQDVREQDMVLNEEAFMAHGVRQYVVEVAGLDPNDRLDFVFRDEAYHWDNNGRTDYFDIDSTTNIDVYPTVPTSSEILGAPIVAYRNGIYEGSQPIESHHSGYYVYASFWRVDRADWTFVIDVIRNGTRYYGVKTFRADRPTTQSEIGIEITKTPWPEAK